MNTVVCVRAVPFVEEEVVINERKTEIIREGLKFVLNESDSYALEEAVLQKEKHGGEVTVVTLSSEQAKTQVEPVIWECYAKGADKALHLVDPAFDELDANATAKILSEAIKKIEFNLILTGALSSDSNRAQVGPALAAFLGIPHATLVVNLQARPAEELAIARRELEEGYQQELEVRLPALFTIQTGINVPRYASFMKIMMAKKRPINRLSLADLNLDQSTVAGWRRLTIQEVNIPPAAKEVKLITGAPEQAATELARVIGEVLGGT